MRYFVDVIGAKTVSKNFYRLGNRLVDARPAFRRILEYVFEVETSVFNSQGRRGGGSWKKLSPAWVKRKADLGLDPRIGHATLAMRNALTKPNQDNQMIKIQKQQLIFAVSLPYIKTQQKNRPVIKMSKNDTAHIRGIMTNHLMGVFAGSRRAR